jgi:hypothetical protein
MRAIRLPAEERCYRNLCPLFAVAVDPRARPIEPGETGLVLRFESAEHTRAFHHLAASRDGAARRVAVVLNDGVTPDRVSLIDFGFHAVVVEVRLRWPSRQTAFHSHIVRVL